MTAKSREQAALWPTAGPTLDPTPSEKGGSVIVMRLTAEEIDRLSEFTGNRTDMPSAIHAAIAVLPAPSPERG